MEFRGYRGGREGVEGAEGGMNVHIQRASPNFHSLFSLEIIMMLIG